MLVYKKILCKKLWNQQRTYFQYQHSKISNLNTDPFIHTLKTMSKLAKSVLDCGCGSGMIFKHIYNSNSRFVGIDISSLAIQIAKEKLSKKNNIVFKIMDLEKLKFADNSFDLVYSTYVLEHLDYPEKVIKEMIRVTKPGGKLIFLAPNIGSPLEYSVSVFNSNINPIKRGVMRFIKSHLYLLKPPLNLDWEKVEPRYLRENKWDVDWDVTTAPYIQSIISYLKKQYININWYSSNLAKSYATEQNQHLSLSLNLLKFIKKVFIILGNFNIPPYKYYGQTLFLIGSK